ncbi:MAG: Lrp/AsnC family transcriptional regulator [Candidatus Hodarchaeaceae archaeon]|nr:Lrp/AsnC family transcriptional regulator [Candidatus Hodarchaeaceae archaeon]
MDEIDLEIIRMLEQDARTPFKEIATKLGVSEGTIHNRVRKMQEEGILIGFSARTNPSKLGMDLTVVIGIRVKGGKLVEVERELSALREVKCVYDVTGDYDAMVIARFRSREELNRFIKEVIASEHVERTVTHVVLNTIKEDFTTLV